MKRLQPMPVFLLCACTSLVAFAQTGPAIQRAANLADGGPAFEVRDAQGRRLLRIECVMNGWYEADAMAARLLGSPQLMTAVLKKGAALAIEDLGPGVFNCAVVVPQP